MDDRFEKIIRSKFEDYTAPVDPDGWTRIAARLPKKRSRRLIRFASVAAAAAVIVLAIVLNTKEPSPQTIQQNELAEQQTTTSQDFANQTKPDATAAPQHKPVEADKSDKTAQQLQSQPNTAANSLKVQPDKPSTTTSAENKSTLETDLPATSTGTDDMIASTNKANTETAIAAATGKDLYEPLPAENKPDNSKELKNSSEWLLAGNFGTSGSANKSTGNNNKIIPLKSSRNTGLLKNYNNAKYAPPLSFGLSVRRNFGKRFGIETGLTYTYLHTNYENVSASDEKWTSHYLGIPINAVLYIWNSNPNWDIYLSAGGMVEKGLSEQCAETSLVGGNTSTYKYSINGLQWSLNGAAGVAYRFTKEFSLYLEPKVSYCFNAQSQHSIRNDWPLAVGINAGLRYSF